MFKKEKSQNEDMSSQSVGKNSFESTKKQILHMQYILL